MALVQGDVQEAPHLRLGLDAYLRVVLLLWDRLQQRERAPLQELHSELLEVRRLHPRFDERLELVRGLGEHVQQLVVLAMLQGVLDPGLHAFGPNVHTEEQASVIACCHPLNDVVLTCALRSPSHNCRHVPDCGRDCLDEVQLLGLGTEGSNVGGLAYPGDLLLHLGRRAMIPITSYIDEN